MTKLEEFNKIIDEMAQLYVRKNSDYGDSFGNLFTKFGMVSSIIRLQDKISRIENLMTKENLVTNESIEDTLKDLANYAVMTIIEVRRKNREKSMCANTIEG